MKPLHAFPTNFESRLTAAKIERDILYTRYATEATCAQEVLKKTTAVPAAKPESVLPNLPRTFLSAASMSEISDRGSIRSPEWLRSGWSFRSSLPVMSTVCNTSPETPVIVIGDSSDDEQSMTAAEVALLCTMVI